jgi:hypothetical protein
MPSDDKQARGQQPGLAQGISRNISTPCQHWDISFREHSVGIPLVRFGSEPGRKLSEF